MIIIKRQYVKEFTPHMEQAWEAAYFEPCECYTVVRTEDDKIIGVGDVTHMWEGRYILWFYAGADIEKKDWLPFLRKFTDTLVQRKDIKRVQCSVDACYQQAIRMAQLIGFKCEGLMKSYLPNGNDAYLFAWVRP